MALYTYLDMKFIYDSYSCRIGKGTHRAVNRFREFARIVSQNNTRTCWVLKCDVRKFFASIDHCILKKILHKHIADTDTLWLLGQVIESFHTNGASGKGLPLGNLTSQLLVNIYMNEFDQFVKHKLKVRYSIRYADDFVLLSQDKVELERLLAQMKHFLHARLKLNMHPDKVFIKTFASGVDFLGWVHFADYRVLRMVTKKRMMRNLARPGITPETTQSYLGLLSHGNAKKLSAKIRIR